MVHELPIQAPRGPRGRIPATPTAPVDARNGEAPDQALVTAQAVPQPAEDDDIEARYAATRRATEELDAIDELEAEFGPELDAEDEAQEPKPELPPKRPEPEEDGVDAGAILADIGRGVIELPMQAVGGLRDAAQETLEAMDSLAIWLNTHVADLTVFDPATSFRLDFPEVPEAATVTGGISRGIIQFVGGMVGAGKFTGLSKLKNLSKAGEAGRLGIQGAIADGIARDPGEENLANLLRELTGEQESAVLNFMASDPDDGEAVARLKKAVEGFGVGAIVDGLILGLGALRASRGVKQAARSDRPLEQQPGAPQAEPGATQAEIDALAKSTEAVPGKKIEEAAIAVRKPVLQPAHRMTIDEIDALLKEEQLSDDGKLLMALGSKEKVDRFKKLERSMNSQIPDVADEASRKFDDEFGNLTNEQERLIFGVFGEPDLTVDEIKEIRTARLDVDKFADDTDVQVGRELAIGMQQTEPERLVELLESGTGAALDQAAFVRIEGGFAELKRRGLNNDEINAFILDGMQTLGFSRADAAEVLDNFSKFKVTQKIKGRDEGIGLAALVSIPLTTEAEPEREDEIQVAGVVSAVAKGFRKAQAGAEEIARQRLGPGAKQQMLVGDLEKPLIEVIEETPPQQFLDETGAAPLPERAININLGRLDTTDDITRAIDATAKMFAGEIDEARRGIQTNEATARLASDMGFTVERLLSRRKGEAFNAETALAARRMLASSASQLVDLAKAAADNGGDRELLAFRRAMVIHKAIQEQVSGLTAEAGRALQSFRILAGTEREMTRNVQEMIDAAGGSGISRKMAERLADAAESGTLTRNQLNQVVRKGALARTSDAFLEVWINSLLSGPQTQAVNILSNALVAAWQIPTRFVASKLPGGGTDAVAAGEAKALLYGMVRGYSEGLILAGRALRTGESTDVLAKIDLPQRRAISAEAFNMSGTAGQAVDLIGEFVRLPGRALLAGDELFKTVGYRMEINARAFRQAASEGLEGDAMARRMDEILRNPPEDIRLASIDAGRYQTFTKPLGEGGQAYQRVVNAVPILRLITPFIRTPVNIMKFVGEGTVLAPLSRNVRAELAAGGARRQMATAKIAMGSMASAFAADMAARGMLTGNGPSDPDTRRIWIETHQPNSIKVGDRWVAYGRLEPLGAFFGVAADIQMIMGDLDEPARQDLATALVIAVGKNVTSKTFLRGLSEAARTLNDPDRFGERYIQQFAGTAVPSIVAQIARVQDPALRDVRTIYDKLCSRVPGCSETLPPRRNIWGEVIILGGGIGPDIMSPIYTSKIKLDPVSEEMLRIDVGQKLPSRQIMGVELTPQEYDEYSRIAGETAKNQLTKLIKRNDYKTASDGPDGLKALAIRKVFAAARANARAQILKNKNFRDLRDRVEALDDERRKKLTRPAPRGDLQLPQTGAPP